MNNQEKGLLYEIHVKNIHIQELKKNAYLWNECPENILIDNGLIHCHNTLRLLRKDIKEGHLHNHKDIGIDIIRIEDNGKCSIVQCKNGYNNGLCVNDIAGIMFRCATRREINTFIYYTNCLSRNIRYILELSPCVVKIDCSRNIDELFDISNYDNKIYFVKLPYENTSEVTEVSEVSEVSEVVEIVPYSYQIEAVDNFRKHYRTNNRGILSLPCGCGKTYTGYLISTHYKHIIILSPLREFASQNLNKFIEYGYEKNNTLLVDTDGNRDIDSIKSFIEGHESLIISCTYNSMDLISKCLDLFNDALFIIDEFHNLSKANISEKDNNIYKLLISNHRILFMSATPRIYDIEYNDIVNDDDNHENDYDDDDSDKDGIDIEEMFGDIVYQMTFYDAISNKYITDYKIWLPSVHENNEELDKELSIYDIDNETKNRSKFLYSCIANNGSRKCIVYCKDTEDMKNMIESMTRLNGFYIMDIDMYSISCDDSAKKRKIVLENFSNNNEKIQLLFNIRILNECIDIPACDSVYISYAPKNKITTIQRISRATRINKNNPYKVANIYIWCEEYEEILETLSSIKEYDIMFKDKVKVGAIDFYNNKDDKELQLIENNKVLLSNYIIGIKEFRIISWEEKLTMIEEYIREYGRLPTTHNKNKNIASLSNWISTQRQNYKKNKEIMKNKNIKNMWEQFVKRHYKLFRTNEEKWLDYLKELEEYIKIHNQLPNHTNKDDNISLLAKWTTTQKRNYVDKNQIMNNDEIRKLWEEIVNKYQEVFKTTEELWKDNLNNLKEYINIHNKLPTSCNQDETIKSLGLWTRNQAKNYDNKQYIMKNEVIQTLWEEFMKENKKLFLNNEELWNYNKIKVEEYIQQYSKLPAQTDKKQDIAVLGNWIQSQKQNYIKKSKIMIDETIRTIWEDFVKQYEKYFMSNEEIWMTRFDELNEYINIHKKIPTFRDKEVVSLVQWMRHQRKNYDNRIQIMKNEDIRKLWKEFTDNNTELFITADEIWIENKNKVEDYIQKYNKLPSQANKDKTISSLASWVYSQKQNYKNREHIMKNNNDIVKEWECFIEKHSILFMSNEEVWTDTFQKVCEYIDKYKKRPSVSSKDNEISYLSRWLTSQRRNYENKEQIMENEEIRKIWEFFVNKYQEIIMSNDELWRYNLNLLEKYIVDNNILPSIHSKISNEKRLGTYIHHQKHNHKYNTMKDASRRKEWEDFIEKYSVLFKYNE